ncbi:ankyrin repeat domain-containing protein [Ulvibacterium marinum]|uniref:Ankyrin repeat domain-containing protein n=1 Tax=Ulvibacterium marinum TaxID=2419782 RepID=A0A3B0BXZ0_9FLAO|nr:ankyrin repeat domain-containing protein [Ulvibacterium marinum]RKN78415.1 ankyrin repeat domain-containing protein [Ulvibacterium marinum]
MKKTILTFASALLLVGATANAKSETHQTNLATPNVVAKVEVSAFCKAIMQGDIDTVKRLIELGEDVNKKSLGMTPAIFAARYNKAEILELLIANGANLRLKSDKGYTAKKYAQLSKATDALAVIEAAMGS